MFGWISSRNTPSRSRAFDPLPLVRLPVMVKNKKSRNHPTIQLRLLKPVHLNRSPPWEEAYFYIASTLEGGNAEWLFQEH